MVFNATFNNISAISWRSFIGGGNWSTQRKPPTCSKSLTNFKKETKEMISIFPIVIFPFVCSNIPVVPAYGVYISQLIRYSTACVSYQDFLDRELLLTRKLLNQGFLLVKLKELLRKFYGRHHDLVDRYGISVSQITTDMFHLS